MRTDSSLPPGIASTKIPYLLILVSFVLQIPLTDALSTVIPSSSTSTPNNIITTPVVICPGFGNDQIDYLTPLSQPRELGLVSCLERRGFQPDRISIVPVQRSDWIRVAGGLLDIGFYTCKAQPTGGGYGWYVKRLKETIDRAYEESHGEKVLVIAHSAGGWLARAAMGDGTWCDEDGEEGVVVRTSDRIKCLVTVGAIHRPPPDASTCATRGALSYTEENYPGAFLKEEGISYVSVGGDAIVGNDDEHSPEIRTDADEVYGIRGEGSSSRVAFTSYKAVGGDGSMTGDGVVPLPWTQLDGARQIQLDGVLHSINEAGTTLPTDRWYGSEGVIDRWLPTVLEEAGITTKDAAVGGGLGLESFQKWAKEKVEEAQNMFSS